MAVASRPQSPTLRFLRAPDGVQLAVHELAGVGSASPVLVSHATGFHAHCYAPLASALGSRYHVVGLDHRGHGHSGIEPGWQVDWRRFGEDAAAIAAELAPQGGLVGFGHSMGGAALLMAAHHAPELFDRLVLFEPISHEGSSPPLSRAEMLELPIVQGALRRRRRFPSTADALENYRGKPPLSLMADGSLEQYVEHGFRPVVDDDGRPAVELRCTPELEAEIFVTGRGNGVWALLPEIATPCLVIGGHVEERQPSAMTEAIADRLPNGTYLLLDHQTHFGPFTHAAEIADLIAG